MYHRHLTSQQTRSCLTFYYNLFYTYHFIRPQYSFLKGGIWARSSIMFVMYIFFFILDFFILICGIYFLWFRVFEEALLSVSFKCLLFVLLHCCWIRMNMYVNIGLLKLEHRTQICKYGPLNARAYYSDIPVGLNFILAATFVLRI